LNLRFVNLSKTAHAEAILQEIYFCNMFPESKPYDLLSLSEEQKAIVLSVMQKMLNSTHFCRSKRYPAMLEYIVCQTLDGDIGALKERSIGAELFGRSLDYETSLDPVVRVTAGELRRRMALFFSENPESPVLIDLPVGSYAVKFHFQDTEEQFLSPDSLYHEDSEKAEELATPLVGAGSQSRNADESDGSTEMEVVESHPAEPIRQALQRHSLQRPVRRMAASLAILLLFAIAATSFYAWHEQRALKFIFWRPVLLADSTPSIIVLGNDGSSSPSSLAKATDNSKVIFDNVLVAANVCGILKEYRKSCPIQLSDKVFFSDMQNHTTILIGALDNIWTLRLMSDLRYQFHFDSSSDPAIPRIQNSQPKFHSRLIADQQNPAHFWALQGEDTISTENHPTDYAIIARYHSALTNGSVIILAGITPRSTAAAEEISLSHDLLRQVYELAPANWQGKNFEAVVNFEMLHDSPVTSKVVAVECW